MLLPQLDGTWRLLYSTKPDTASPIQNATTSSSANKVYQEVCARVFRGGYCGLASLTTFTLTERMSARARAHTRTHSLSLFARTRLIHPHPLTHAQVDLTGPQPKVVNQVEFGSGYLRVGEAVTSEHSCC